MSGQTASTSSGTPAQEDEWIKTVCYMCYSCCGIKVHKVNGTVVKIEGDPANPHNYAKICPKGNAGIMGLYDPNRLTKPLKRTNAEKGIGVDPNWVEISWDEALDQVAARMKKIRQEDPRKLIFLGLDFNIWPVGWFFCIAYGTPNMVVGPSGYYCGNGVHAVLYMTTGAFYGEVDLERCNHLILWGTQFGFLVNTNANTMTQRMAEARMRGMKVVSIDPLCTNAAAKSDEWVPIKPGTDGALALGMLNVLVNDLNIYDREFLKNTTNGPYLIGPDQQYLRDKETNKPMVWDLASNVALPFDSSDVRDPALVGSYEIDSVEVKPSFQLLKEHVKKYTPKMVSEITTVPAETVYRLAKEFGEAARVGSKITVDGRELPYRPAAVIWNKGTSQHTNCLATGISLQLLNTIMGAIDVPGGYASTNPLGPFWGPTSDADGMLIPAQVHLVYPNSYPLRPIVKPKTLQLQELFPVAAYTTPLWEDGVLSGDKFGLDYKPEMLIHTASNIVLAGGNPSRMAEVLKKIPFQVSFATHMDETAEFADIVFPDSHYLEKLAPFPNSPIEYIAAGPGEWYWMVQQPVVKERGECRNWGAAMLELTHRAGMQGDLCMVLNAALGFRPPYTLDPTHHYTWEEFVDTWCKGWFGPLFGLDWFKETGFLKWPKKIEEAYPRSFIKGRIPVYYEHFVKAGEGVRQVTAELGLEWDTSQYNNIPDWQPCPSFKPSSPEYDLIAVNYKLPFQTFSITSENAWLNELSEHHPSAYRVLMGTNAARRKGIKDGDRIWIESDQGGKVQGITKLTEAIHPEVIAIAGTFGHWAKGMPVARDKGVHIGTLWSKDTGWESRRRVLDPLSASLDMCFRVKVYR